MVNKAPHPLENPIWSALTTHQSEIAQIGNFARRFPREITALAGIQEATPESFESLATITDIGDLAVLFLESDLGPLPGWELVEASPLIQMTLAKFETALITVDFQELTLTDVPEMVALAELTKPGPFGIRTIELGNFIGIRRSGALVAMAGQRLRVPGYTEVSAVCTHPDHLGHRYASALIVEVVSRILATGDTPFLHARLENTGAIRLYEKLGFKMSKVSRVNILQRSGQFLSGN